MEPIPKPSDLPQISRVIDDPRLAEACRDLPRSLVVKVAREVVDELRSAVLAGTAALADLELTAVVDRAARRALRLSAPALRRVINATGVVIHTNLGRAPLPQAALDHLSDVASGYSNLEYRLAERRRGKREELIRDLLARVTGAEAAHVVNNNAAAVMISLACLARDREVIISRGELVEIGGGFRIPDVMAASGARIREVGTTNRTHLRDYEAALGDNTALLLKVHASNFAMRGFVSSVPAAELVELGRRAGIPVMEDLGSGCLVDTAAIGLPHEPTPGEALAAGVDLVTFSGDKLLGGPQAGIMVGKAEIVERIAGFPMARALRACKLTLSALEETLRIYEQGAATALAQIPVLAALSASPEAVATRCAALLGELGDLDQAEVGTRRAESAVGGGALPEVYLPTTLVRIRPRLVSATALDSALRSGMPPVVGRLEEDEVLLDLRTVADETVPELALALRRALATDPGSPGESSDL